MSRPANAGMMETRHEIIYAEMRVLVAGHFRWVHLPFTEEGLHRMSTKMADAVREARINQEKPQHD